MLPISGVPETIRQGMMKYRELFCRDEGFEYISRYVTGLIVSPNKPTGYCWRICFKVLEVLFLAHASYTFLPSKQAYGIHIFRHFWVRQQYRDSF
jgi:hypothetical protein